MDSNLYQQLRTSRYAQKGCELCREATTTGNFSLADEHHPREVVNTIALRAGDAKLERIGWKVDARDDGQRILQFTSPHGGLPWYSYDLDSLTARLEQRSDAKEFVLCDGLGGYTRHAINAATLRKILAEFPPSHPMFRRVA